MEWSFTHFLISFFKEYFLKPFLSFERWNKFTWRLHTLVTFIVYVIVLKEWRHHRWSVLHLLQLPHFFRKGWRRRSCWRQKGFGFKTLVAKSSWVLFGLVVGRCFSCRGWNSLHSYLLVINVPLLEQKIINHKKRGLWMS